MKFYRYELNTGYYEDGSVECVMNLYEFHSLKETPCGYWIKLGYSSKKWVSNTSKKRYAYPTKGEAFDSLKHRTKRRLSYAKSTLERAELATEFLNKITKGEDIKRLRINNFNKLKL